LDRTYGQRIPREVRKRNSGIFKETRLANKCGEVQPETSEDVPVSRMAVEFSKSDSNLREEEGARFAAVSNQVESVCQEGEDSPHQTFSIGDRETVGNTVAVLSSQFVFVRDESIEGTSSQEEFMARTSETDGDTIKRPRVVERQLEKELSNTPDITITRGGIVDGCLPHRVGGTHMVEGSERSIGGIGSTRFLGKRMEFQSEGIGSSKESSPTFSDPGADETDSPLVATYGQFHDGLQYQQESFHPQSDTTHEEAIHLSSQFIHDDKGGSRERFGEWEGGQFIKNEQSRGLQVIPQGAPSSITEPWNSDINGSVCVQSEPPTQDILLSIKQGSDESIKGRVQYILEGEGGSIGPPPSTSATKVFAKDKGREDSSSGDCSSLVRSSVDSTFEIDDSEDDSDGGVEIIIAPRKIDGEASRQVAPRYVGGVFSGRRNDEGQQMVLDLLQGRGLLEISDWFFKSVAESTWRNYRRGFTLFSVLLKRSGVDPLTIKDVDTAVAALIRALKVACEIKSKLSAIFVMKTAVIRLFSFMFNVDLSHMPMVKMALRCLTLNDLPRKEMLRLRWSVDQLLMYLMNLPMFELMEFNQLTAVAIVLCMAFTALRFSEIYNLDIQESSPSEDKSEWKFWVHVKGHDFKEPVILHRIDNCHLDPVSALSTLRIRLCALVAGGKEKPIGFWYKVLDKDCSPLSYDGVRGAAMQILHQAGINETKPYHIKHAVLTCLHESGASARDIAAFARHRFESMAAYQHYISYDAGKMSVKSIVQSISKNAHPN
jgi:site-specific recombinase XerD